MSAARGREGDERGEKRSINASTGEQSSSILGESALVTAPLISPLVIVILVTQDATYIPVVLLFSIKREKEREREREREREKSRFFTVLSTAFESII